MPKIAEKAPEFAGITAYEAGSVKKVSLSDYRGRWLVLFFYPLDFTFV
jgi:alkyl hydroperoxide reductase subunit AhpC